MHHMSALTEGHAASPFPEQNRRSKAKNANYITKSPQSPLRALCWRTHELQQNNTCPIWSPSNMCLLVLDGSAKIWRYNDDGGCFFLGRQTVSDVPPPAGAGGRRAANFSLSSARGHCRPFDKSPLAASGHNTFTVTCKASTSRFNELHPAVKRQAVCFWDGQSVYLRVCVCDCVCMCVYILYACSYGAMTSLIFDLNCLQFWSDPGMLSGAWFFVLFFFFLFGHKSDQSLILCPFSTSCDRQTTSCCCAPYNLMLRVYFTTTDNLGRLYWWKIENLWWEVFFS